MKYSKRTSLIIFMIIFVSGISFSQVGIGTTEPDPSSALDITSISAGILVPRMTEAQRMLINSPATGLLVYQNDNITGFWFFDGVSWSSLSGGGNSGEFQSIGGVVQNTTSHYVDSFLFGS